MLRHAEDTRGGERCAVVNMQKLQRRNRVVHSGYVFIGEVRVVGDFQINQTGMCEEGLNRELCDPSTAADAQ